MLERFVNYAGTKLKEFGWGSQEKNEPPRRATIRERFEAAGFGSEELEGGIYDKRAGVVEWLEMMSDESLKFLSESVRDPFSRKTMLYSFKHYYYFDDNMVGFTGTVNRLSKRAAEDPDLIPQFTNYTGNLGKRSQSGDSEYFPYELLAGAEVMENKRIFDLFDNDPEALFKLIRRVTDDSDTEINLGGLISVLRKIKSSGNAEVLLDGVNSSIFERLSPEVVDLILDSPPEVGKLVRDYFKSDRTWVDSIHAFKPLLREMGYEVVEGQEEERDVIARVAKRESKLHPWVTTGLGTTVGPEIEFPLKNPVVRSMEERDVFKVLEVIGFKRGGGAGDEDGRLDEASYGPLNDPETSNLIYQMYVDSGIINTKEDLGMTLHFNVGKLERTEATREALVTLVRALYLTGAAYDPHSGDPVRSMLSINPNEDHWEAKVFDVTTDRDFKWNFRSASYLTWAIKAGQDLGKGRAGNRWRKEMANIWRQYQQEMKKGLSVLGKEKYLNEKRNTDSKDRPLSHVTWVHDQLKKIWKDENYYKLPNLNVVGQSETGVPNEDGIEGLQVGEIWYPNIALYARIVTNRAVAGIEAIAHDVEESCIRDIKVIDALRGVRRERKLRSFVRRYGLGDGNSKSLRKEEKRFQQVRSLMLPDEENQLTN